MRASAYAKKQAKILSKDKYIMDCVRSGEHWCLVFDGNEHGYLNEAIRNGEIEFPQKILNDKQFLKMNEDEQFEYLSNLLMDMIQDGLEKLQ